VFKATSEQTVGKKIQLEGCPRKGGGEKKDRIRRQSKDNKPSLFQPLGPILRIRSDVIGQKVGEGCLCLWILGYVMNGCVELETGE